MYHGRIATRSMMFSASFQNFLRLGQMTLRSSSSKLNHMINDVSENFSQSGGSVSTNLQ
jgi:hypothetical protein